MGPCLGSGGFNKGQHNAHYLELVAALCLFKQVQLVVMTIPLGTSRDRKEDKWRLQRSQDHLTL